jgi:hypothetical protein
VLTDGFKDAAVILAHKEQALPLLRAAYAAASGEKHKLRCAQILAVLGDDTGINDLIAAIDRAKELDKGWRYKGWQFGHDMSPLDRLIYAVGCTGNRRGVRPIVKKLKLLTERSEFSHFRAMALALERIGDPAAATPLAEILAKPGIQGHVMQTIDDALKRAKVRDTRDYKQRRNAIRELMLARALFRCGDRGGLGKRILKAYTKDLRGHFLRHANAVLEEAEQKSTRIIRKERG